MVQSFGMGGILKEKESEVKGWKSFGQLEDCQVDK